MKHLEEEKVDQLLGIINLYPSMRIMHFSEDSHLLSKKIAALCTVHDYEYQLNCINETCFEKATTKYSDNKHIKIKKFDLAQPRYTIQAKLYDYLFVTAAVSDEMRPSFLKKAYAAIKNAGLILIFVPGEDLHLKHLWTELLQDNNFVATNTIDLFPNYDVIISKKMHGWGG